MNRIWAAVLGLATVTALATPALADIPRDSYVLRDPTPYDVSAPGSNVIFLNRCVGGCTVHQSGSDNSTTDSSTIGGGVLSAFNGTDAEWTQIKQCMIDVFTPFNVVITDTDPGTASHLEIMIAGLGSDIGVSGAAGIAPFRCQSYQNNALVFAFANLPGQSVNDICWTAAQEIAHTWSLDHSTDAADPLTYSLFGSRRYYQDTAAQCGSWAPPRTRWAPA